MSPFPTFYEQIQTLSRFFVPYFLITLLLGVSIVSFVSPYDGFTPQVLVRIVLYFWFLYRPTLMPVWLVCILGLINDLVVGMPLGLTPLIYLSIRQFILYQRTFLMAQSFVILWSVFIVMLVFYEVIQWGAVSVLFAYRYSFLGMVDTVIYGALIFPCVSSMLYLTHKALPVAGTQKDLGI